MDKGAPDAKVASEDVYQSLNSKLIEYIYKTWMRQTSTLKSNRES